MVKNYPRVTILGINYWPEPSGIAPYTSGLAVGLAETGWDVTAVTSYPHYPDWKVSVEYDGRRISETLDGVNVHRRRSFIPRRPHGIFRLIMELSFGLVSTFAPWDRPSSIVMVSPALFSVAIAQFRARLFHRNAPVTVWVQDIYSLGVTETGVLGSFGAKVMQFIESRVLRNADSVVVIHERFRSYLVDHLAVDESKVIVVRNWTHTDPTFFDKRTSREKFLWRNEVVVLHAGNLGAKQALENVVEAARLADELGTDIRFVLLGNGNQRDRLLSLAKGISRIEFLDSLDEPGFQMALAAADVLLVHEKAGLTEMAVPSKLTSYFASGTPVLAVTDKGSITAGEIEASKAGVRVDTDDPMALIAAAMTLGEDSTSSRIYGENGIRYGMANLSRANAVAQYDDHLKFSKQGNRLPDSTKAKV